VYVIAADGRHLLPGLLEAAEAGPHGTRCGAPCPSATARRTTARAPSWPAARSGAPIRLR
jgi:hypothetical protein